LVDVKVSGAKANALGIECKSGQSCAEGAITLDRVVLEKSAMGLVASGAHIVMTGGSSSNHGGLSLTGGRGIVMKDDGRLELDGVAVENNASTGVVISGTKTSAALKGVTVSGNGERGVWAQLVEGTLDAPAVKIENSEITKNKVIGFGALEARGIIIV